MIGEGLRILKDKETAMVAYQAVIKNYPKSKWAKLAKSRVAAVTDQVMKDLTHGLDIMELGD